MRSQRNFSSPVICVLLLSTCTKNYEAIEDNDIVHMKDGTVSILKSNYEKEKPASVQCALSLLEIEVEQIKKGDSDHFIKKEIHEQSHSLVTSTSGRLKDGFVGLGGMIDHMRTIRRNCGIIFIGCGTSYHAALAVRPIMQLAGTSYHAALAVRPIMQELTGTAAGWIRFGPPDMMLLRNQVSGKETWVLVSDTMLVYFVPVCWYSF